MAINLKHTSTLYVEPYQPISKALEFLLLKKEVIVNITDDPVPTGNVPQPAFVHNNFLVFGVLNTLEFLIDFFPEPRAFPDDPTSRAIHRMLITETLKDYYPLYNTDLERLATKLNEIKPALSDTSFFLNDTVYAVDCILAPLAIRALNTNSLTPTLIRYATRLENFFRGKQKAAKIYHTQQRAEQSSWA